MKAKLTMAVAGALVIAAGGLGYAAGMAGHGMMSAAGEMTWREIRPGSPVMVVDLWGDPIQGEYGRLLKLPAGFVAPTHAHTGDYNAISLSGNWRHGFDGGEERALAPGAYVFQPGGEMHDDACDGPEDCVILLHQHEKADFIPKEE